MAHWRWVWTTKRDTWVAACTEPANVKPFKEPPRRVRIIGHFKVPYNLRDEGGLRDWMAQGTEEMDEKTLQVVRDLINSEPGDTEEAMDG
jgi:hypothetical protein